MRNITPPAPLRADQCRINTAARAVVINLQVEKSLILGKGDPLSSPVVLNSLDGSGFKITVPREFAPFAEPGDFFIVSLTLLKNILEPLPEVQAELDRKLMGKH